MKNKNTLIISLVALGIFMSACFCNSDDTEKTERWETPEVSERVEEKVQEKQDAPEQVKGSSLNVFFPADKTMDHARTFTQEKTGYAEATYVEGESEIKIAIADVVDQSDTRQKYTSAPDKLMGYPMMTRGKNSSMVLVNDRYQVKVSSKTATPEQRKAWLEKVELNGLAAMAPSK